MTGIKKAWLIAHLWPLLRDGQDPHSLAARVAYHLHRTHNRTTALTRAGITADRTYASDLVQGRLPLSEADVAFMATRLALPFPELVRELTPYEAEGWSFYRTSGRHRIAVWERARSYWLASGLNEREAAQAIGMSRANLSNVLTNRSRRVLNYEQATRLGAALNAPLLPVQLVDGLQDQADRAP